MGRAAPLALFCGVLPSWPCGATRKPWGAGEGDCWSLLVVARHVHGLGADRVDAIDAIDSMETASELLGEVDTRTAELGGIPRDVIASAVGAHEAAKLDRPLDHRGRVTERVLSWVPVG